MCTRASTDLWHRTEEEDRSKERGRRKREVEGEEGEGADEEEGKERHSSVLSDWLLLSCICDPVHLCSTPGPA